MLTPIKAYLPAAPPIAVKGHIAMLLKALMIFTLPVTVSAKLGWQDLRRALAVPWLAFHHGNLPVDPRRTAST